MDGTKLEKAVVELMTVAARNAGIKGDLEIVILRRKEDEKVTGNSRRRQSGLPRRKSVAIL